MKEKMLTFFPPYNKSHFYQLMGAFFSERSYRKRFPYLINSSNTYWYLIVDLKNKVQAFSSYEVKNSKIEINEFFASDAKDVHEVKQLLFRKMLHDIRRKFPNKLIVTTTNSNEEKVMFEAKGFKIFKKTKNYIFLRRECLEVWETE